MEGSSPRAIRERWSLQDYKRQTDYWHQFGPPQRFILMHIAESLGVKFRLGAASTDRAIMPGAPAVGAHDPRSIMAELGQSELVPYVPPRKGLIIDQGGSA